MVQKSIYTKTQGIDFKFQISRYCFLVQIPTIVVYTQRGY